MQAQALPARLAPRAAHAPKMRLTYFGGPGGRAEPSRLALHMAGVEYVDERVNYEVRLLRMCSIY